MSLKLKDTVLRDNILSAVKHLLLMGLWLVQLGALSFAQMKFVDVSSLSGIDFVHVAGDSRAGYLPSLMASGLALLDYDNDGLCDAYFLNGHHLPQPLPGDQATNQLFRNLGKNKFENVSVATGSADTAFALGIAVADIDNDGFQDMAISNLGGITLLHNNGDGSFSDATQSAGLSPSTIVFGAGVAFLDIENDGDVDLYVADYVDFQIDGFDALAKSTYPYPPGPDHFSARSDHLYLNAGDGTFSDFSQEAGIAELSSPSMGVVCGDFDGDHDSDIFVCSDAKPNLLWINDGHGLFQESAELFGVAYNAQGMAVGSMGAEASDVDNDGAEDLFITDYSTQMPILFQNLGAAGFADITNASRAGRDVIPHANWGAGLVDFDNDGDRDLMIGNGHLFAWAHEVEQLTEYKVRNCLLANDGNGRFLNVTANAGSGLEVVESTRGLAFADLDNDGDVDAIALNHNARSSTLENRSHASGHWVEIELVGEIFNRDGIGAKVTVRSGTSEQAAEVHSGRGYQSDYGQRLHFGLGQHSSIELVRVDWLGSVSEYRDLAIDRVHTLSQGRQP